MRYFINIMLTWNPKTGTDHARLEKQNHNMGQHCNDHPVQQVARGRAGVFTTYRKRKSPGGGAALPI